MLSATNPAKPLATGSYASTPANAPALDRVPSGRNEKAQRGARSPGKAKEKKGADEDFERRVREKVDRRLTEMRAREEIMG